MGKGKLCFKWYWFLADPLRLSITWMLAVVFACISFHIWPPLALIALLCALTTGKIVQLRGAEFLEAMGSERIDPPRYFLAFWWCILFIEAAVSVGVAVLQEMRG